MKKAVSAAVLVGGKSSRMGCNKAFLPFGRQKLIESIIARLKKFFPDVFLVSSDPRPYLDLQLPVYVDLYRNCGPLGGIHRALLSAASAHVFICACDLPFLDLKLVRLLVANISNYDVVVPCLDNRVEPLFAVYGRGVSGVIESSLGRGQYKVSAIFTSVRTRYIDRAEIEKVVNPERVFFNLNSPKDIQRAKIFGRP